MNKNKRESIIQKCIDISCIEKNGPNNNNLSFGWGKKISNWKDNIIYNYVRFNSKFKMIPAKIHIYNKIFDTSIPKEKTKYEKKFSKIILVTYRSYFRPQINVKNNKRYTTDCGWGCMIRSSQMILCRGLYKIFKYNLKQNDNLTRIIAPFIMENNLKINETEYFGMTSYINKLKSLGKKDIIEIDPPFSIHKICILGEIFGRTSGEWFSDYELPKIYDIINSTFDIIPNLSIIHFNSCVDFKTIINRCFKEENLSDKINNDIVENNNSYNENKIIIDGKNYIMEKMGLIFISVRLGIEEVNPDYFPSLKRIFDCKENIGFIGGKKNSNSASYFFGYYDNNLLFLDPHHNYPSIKNLDDNNINTYVNKVVYKINLTSLKAAFTIGFVFRNIKEFNELLIYFRSLSNEKYSCFTFMEKEIKRNNKEINDILNLISDKDDF
jgi:cysteine protease ATG4